MVSSLPCGSEIMRASLRDWARSSGVCWARASRRSASASSTARWARRSPIAMSSVARMPVSSVLNVTWAIGGSGGSLHPISLSECRTVPGTRGSSSAPPRPRPASAGPEVTHDLGGQPRAIHGGEIGMPRRGHVVEDGGAVPARRAQDAAVPARDDVAARPRVGLLDVARREHLLVLHEHDPRAIAPALVRPYARDDVVDGIDDVLVTVVAELPVRALRGVAADRQRGVDQEIEPVHRLLDAGTALRPDRPSVLS